MITITTSISTNVKPFFCMVIHPFGLGMVRPAPVSP